MLSRPFWQGASAPFCNGALLCFCTASAGPCLRSMPHAAALLSWYCAAPEILVSRCVIRFRFASIDCIALCGPVGSPGRQRRSAVHVLHHCSDQRSPGAGSAPGRRRRGGLCRQGRSQGQGSRQRSSQRPFQRPGRPLDFAATATDAQPQFSYLQGWKYDSIDSCRQGCVTRRDYTGLATQRYRHQPKQSKGSCILHGRDISDKLSH